MNTLVALIDDALEAARSGRPAPVVLPGGLHVLARVGLEGVRLYLSRTRETLPSLTEAAVCAKAAGLEFWEPRYAEHRGLGHIVVHELPWEESEHVPALLDPVEREPARAGQCGTCDHWSRDGRTTLGWCGLGWRAHDGYPMSNRPGGRTPAFYPATLPEPLTSWRCRCMARTPDDQPAWRAA